MSRLRDPRRSFPCVSNSSLSLSYSSVNEGEPLPSSTKRAGPEWYGNRSLSESSRNDGKSLEPSIDDRDVSLWLGVISCQTIGQWQAPRSYSEERRKERENFTRHGCRYRKPGFIGRKLSRVADSAGVAISLVSLIVDRCFAPLTAAVASPLGGVIFG